MVTYNRQVLTAVLMLSAGCNNVSSFSTAGSSSMVSRRQQNTAFVISHTTCVQKMANDDDWYEGYDEFVKKLDFEGGGWDNSGSEMSSSSNDGRQQRGGGRGNSYNNDNRGGGGGGGRMQRGGHDYTRAGDDDTSKYLDTSTVERLLGERLQCRKTGEFDQADGIRDQLLSDHGVTIWDREKVWTTNRDRSGGSNRHSENGRYGAGNNRDSRNGRDDRRGPPAPRRPRDFGPKGHDYMQGGAPIDTSRCTITVDQIDQLIAERLKFKMSRNFREADAIQDALRGQGVFVNDRFKEWRADGEDWGQSDRNSKSEGRSVGEFRVREYSQRGPCNGLSSEDISLISSLVAKRSEAKASRDYDLADSVREQLTDQYAVTVDDKKCEWALMNEEYIFSGPPSQLSDNVDLQILIGNKLSERSIAKQRRDFDTADAIRNSLNEEYKVLIDDRNKEWSIDLDFVEDDNTASYDDVSEVAEEDDDEDASPSAFKNIEDEEVDEEEEEVEDETSSEEGGSDTIESLNSLTVPQLKEKLRDAGLPVSGRKSELIERLTSQ